MRGAERVQHVGALGLDIEPPLSKKVAQAVQLDVGVAI